MFNPNSKLFLAFSLTNLVRHGLGHITVLNSDADKKPGI